MSVEALPAILQGLATGAFQMKLQQIVVAAFGTQVPIQQVPTERFKERERVSSEPSKVIEASRQTRLAAAGEIPPSAFVFEVVRFRGHWRILHRKKHSSRFPDQTAAITAAKKLAVAKRDQGHSVRVVLRRTDGTEVPQAIDD
jgi:hypothetical protein